MRSRKIEPATLIGAFCVVVGIALVVLVTRNSSASPSETSRGEPTSLLDIDGATTTTTEPSIALRSGVVEIPPGQRGVAIRVDFVAGVGGYAAPGDQVDIYATTETPDGAVTDRVLADVLVLDVSLQIAPSIDPENPGVKRPDSGSLTYLLAVDNGDVDEVIFNTRRADVYLALTPEK